ncbi:fumarylacetoacetate hydrolase family protein [Aquisalibacillus elongatus]|uniref:2-keto-4-pentenoate hydratase/2-oxohepta-3-ene-1,7-dioic acid hydratase in catechol pathway n=1 Tax=Aquisalibacillus elongatus TaxID=485577 RepID=A0A3N5BGB6_9BACI|nr:fumarylacetoacetate hydrolase family protein [Aquisalibacillus elongatus]RPF54310.1 2-keto-4-pentenoate hydratase/2-oxohepta-3-ene-1,7-dioic acid hydratase in catechol pathway [Aquisalibacillus elongatus]
MKLLTFRFNEIDYWGILKDDGFYYSDQLMTYFPNLLSVIENIDHLNLEKDLNKFADFDQCKILAPLKSRKNIMCIGKNYRDHAMEMTNDPSSLPEHPVIFTKAPSTVIGHKNTIHAHSNVTKQLDYEGELAVIIGQKGVNIKRENAMDHVFGYTILNDVTARDLQKRHQQFFKGKSLDTFAPMGPYIVTKDEIHDVHHLNIKTYVNDELRQDGNTKDMIFSIAELIEVLSDGMTLEPGDIIATGTPSGVGKGFDPPKFLNEGDEVRVEVEQIGTLSNQVSSS